MAEEVAAGNARLCFEVDASAIDMFDRNVVRVELKEEGCNHSRDRRMIIRKGRDGVPVRSLSLTVPHASRITRRGIVSGHTCNPAEEQTARTESAPAHVSASGWVPMSTGGSGVHALSGWAASPVSGRDPLCFHTITRPPCVPAASMRLDDW